MVEATDIHVGYDGTLVLTGVGLVAHPGQVVGLIGPNGSGKTTLLRTLYHSLRPRAGLVCIDGVPVSEMNERQIALRLGVVAQESAPELPVTVADMVLLGRSPHRSDFQGYSLQDDRLAARALTRVGARGFAHRPFATLSGGEKQRVLIARTLAQEADHLLLDEPTNHLDIRYQHEILQLVRSLEVTTVIVLHDLNLAGRYCDLLVLLVDGKILRTGIPDEVLTREVLEPVYGVAVRRVDDDSCVQLTFGPAPDLSASRVESFAVNP
jgi:iron complex transport system ATP-binding protein